MKRVEVRMAAWGIGGPLVCGQPFTVIIGARHQGGRSLAGRSVTILNENGHEQGSFQLGEDYWGGTSLHWAEATLLAPLELKCHSWTIRFDGEAGASLPLSFATTRPLVFVAHIEAVDAVSASAIPNAHIRIGPYAGVAGQDGRVAIDIAGGSYSLQAWKTAFVASSQPLEVSSNLSVRVELAPMIDRDPQYVAKDAEFIWH